MDTGSLVLAQLNSTATDTARTFFGSDLGNILTSVLGSVGLLLILWSLVKAFKHVTGGKLGEAIKAVLSAVLVSVFLFYPPLFGSLIDVAVVAVEALIKTFGGLAARP